MQTQYPSDDHSCNEFHYATAQMKPFPIQNKDGLSNAYTDELYQYRHVNFISFVVRVTVFGFQRPAAVQRNWRLWIEVPVLP